MLPGNMCKVKGPWINLTQLTRKQMVPMKQMKSDMQCPTSSRRLTMYISQPVSYYRDESQPKSIQSITTFI